MIPPPRQSARFTTYSPASTSTKQVENVKIEKQFNRCCDGIDDENDDGGRTSSGGDNDKDNDKLSIQNR